MLPYITLFRHQIPTYGICSMLAVALCYCGAYIRTRRRGMKTDPLLAVCACALGVSMIGSKILYLAVSFSPKQLLSLIQAGQFNALMTGGFVFYGGLLGGIFGAWIGSKIVKQPLMTFADVIVPFLPLGYAVGRVGCFLAGCCYGKTIHGKVFPVQLLDSAVSLLSSILLVCLSAKKLRGFALVRLYLILYAIQRFLIEFLRADTVRGIFGIFSTSQWISIGIFGFCMITFLFHKNTAKQ